MRAIPLLDNELLDAVERQWRQQGVPLAARLQAGLRDEEIDRALDPVGLRLPTEARAWWRWRNGARAMAGSSAARTLGGPGFEFLPLEEAVDRYLMQRRIAGEAAEGELPEDHWWRPEWFPVTVASYGGVVTCDCSVPEGEATPIRMIDWGGRENFAEPVAPSFGQMVEWWLDALERGVWRWDAALRRWALDHSRLEVPARALTRLV